MAPVGIRILWMTGLAPHLWFQGRGEFPENCLWWKAWAMVATVPVPEPHPSLLFSLQAFGKGKRTKRGRVGQAKGC